MTAATITDPILEYLLHFFVHHVYKQEVGCYRKRTANRTAA